MLRYEPTIEEQALLQELREFKSAVRGWSGSSDQSERQRLRSTINQQLEEIREIVRLAGCHQTLVVTPPPIVGGPQSRIDLFSCIFEPVYGRSQVDAVCDMLDRTIGVIAAGQYQERRAQVAQSGAFLSSGAGRKVFLVHGHDDGAKEHAARFLEKLQLEAIVLHEQPSSGQTIIEKVERYSDVAFAVILLTPDDQGHEKGGGGASRPRARQNVILELGFFMGKLGRSHVAALVKGDLERPSDYDGVVYISMDEAGAWRMSLARELKAAGLDVDLNDVA